MVYFAMYKGSVMNGVEKVLKVLDLLHGNPSENVKVDEQGFIVEFMEKNIPYFEIEELLIEVLADIDDGSKNKMIEELKAKHDELKARWLANELVSLKDFMFLTGLSRDMIEKFIGYSQMNLKYYQLHEGSKIFFKRSDWLSYQKYLEN